MIQKALDEVSSTEQKRAANSNNRKYLFRMLGEIKKLRFPAPDDDQQIKLIEEIDYQDEDPNSQDRSSQGNDEEHLQPMSPL